MIVRRDPTKTARIFEKILIFCKVPKADQQSEFLAKTNGPVLLFGLTFLQFSHTPGVSKFPCRIWFKNETHFCCLPREVQASCICVVCVCFPRNSPTDSRTFFCRSRSPLVSKIPCRIWYKIEGGGWAALGWVGLGWARLGSARLDSARLGSAALR